MEIRVNELTYNESTNTVTAYNGEQVDAQTTNKAGDSFDYVEETITPTNDWNLLDNDAKVEFFDSVIIAGGERVIRAGSQRRMIQPSETRQDAFKSFCERYNVSIELLQCTMQSVLANATSQARAKTVDDYKSDIARIEESIKEIKDTIKNPAIRAQVLKGLERDLKISKGNFDKALKAQSK